MHHLLSDLHQKVITENTYQGIIDIKFNETACICSYIKPIVDIMKMQYSSATC